jgi:hypothetical protein
MIKKKKVLVLRGNGHWDRKSGKEFEKELTK